MILFHSQVKDGNMSLDVPINRKRFFLKVGVRESWVVNMHLAHGNRVRLVTGKDGGKLFEKTDGLVTNSDNIDLAVLVADCLPIAIYDPVTRSRGLVHAGWRGLTNGVIKNSIEMMKKELKVKSRDLMIYIGAHVCQKHYEIKADVSAKFNGYPGSLKKVGGRIFLDLAEVARQQLVAIGVKDKNISIDRTCTFEDKTFFSYRRNLSKKRILYLLLFR